MCTDVGSRGLDVLFGVSLVINMSVGLSITNYIHRCGRTGRAGEIGFSHTFLVKGDEHLAQGLVEILSASNQKVPQELLELAETMQKKSKSIHFSRDNAFTEVSSSSKKISEYAEANAYLANENENENENENDDDDEDRKMQQLANREKQRRLQQKKKEKEHYQSKKKIHQRNNHNR